MKGHGTDESSSDEAEATVLPTPYVTEERDLRAELERLNGTWADGLPSVITLPRPGGGLWIYLSGMTTLFTNFVERAYVLGEEDARRIILRYPALLGHAEVVARGRRTSGHRTLADQRLGDESAGPSRRRWGEVAIGLSGDPAHDPGEKVEQQDRQPEAEGEENDWHEQTDDPDEQAAEEQPGE